MADPDRVIRASELVQYSYCARAWWLGSVEGVPSANVRELEAGTVAHERHGRRLQLSVWAMRMGLLCLGLGLAALVLYLAIG